MRLRRAAIILLLAGAAFTPGVAAPAEKNISLDLSDADLRQVIDGIMRGAGVNYVFEGPVEGKVTAFLENVPFEQALEAVLTSTGYTATQGEYGYTIRKREAPKPPAPVTPPAATKPVATLAPSPGAGLETDGRGAEGGSGTAQGQGDPNQMGPGGAQMPMGNYGMQPGWGYGPQMGWGYGPNGYGPDGWGYAPQAPVLPPYAVQIGRRVLLRPMWPTPTQSIGPLLPNLGPQVFGSFGGQGSPFTPLGNYGW